MESKEVFIDIDQLVPDGLQPRKVFDDKDIDDLAQDINTNGLHEGIDINPLLDGRETRYTIIDGERRYRAIQLILDYGQVKCNLYAYKSQKDIDDHRASKEFHKTKWPPVNRAEFLEYYMGTHKVRKQDLARRFSRSHTTIGRWLAPAKHKDILNALRNDRIGFSQAVALSEIDSAETRENALSDVAVPKGEKKTTLEEVVRKIALLVQNSKGEIKTSTKTPPEERATKDGKVTVNDGEGGSTEEALLSPETDPIVSKAFERGGEKGTEDAVLEEDDTSPDAMLTTQSPLPEEGVEVTPGSDPSTETKITKFVNRMLRLGEATTTHMKEKELEALPDAGYRKLLKDYEEASFEIDGFRDFLHGRENNGSVQFNRAKRLHNAIREFDAHSISSTNEATNLRSIKIETKKKLTKDVDILDNIINGKGGE